MIGADNEQLGIMSSAQALDMAIEADLTSCLSLLHTIGMSYNELRQKFRLSSQRRKRNLKRTRNKLSLKRYRCR
ncbi:MAG: hypothetical protein ACLRRE_08870 [[Eubacterium] siraeum]